MPSKSGSKKKKNKRIAAIARNTNSSPLQKFTDLLGQHRAVIEKAFLAIMMLGIALLLLIGPFQRGLFFTWELLYAKALIFGLLVIWGIFRLLKKDGRLMATPLDYCLGALLLAYIMSLAVAVNQRIALEEVLKIAAYLVVYLIVADVCRYWPFKKTLLQKEASEEEGPNQMPQGVTAILNLLLLSAAIVVVATLGTAAGTFDVEFAYSGNRIASPLGYENSAAAYFMAAYLLAVALANATGGPLRHIYLVSASMFLIAIVLTFSRGAWLLLPPLAILLVIVSIKGDRMRVFLYLIATTLAALPFAMLVDNLFRSEQPGQAWLPLFAMIGLTLLLSLLIDLYFRQSYKLRLPLAGSAAFVVVGGLAVVAVLPVFAPLHLERGLDEGEGMQVLEHVVGNVKQGEEYILTLEVDADFNSEAGLLPPDYVWGVRVLSFEPDFRNVEIFNYTGAETEGWEKNEFNFSATESSRRLLVRLYNYYPGTNLEAKSVSLSTGEETKNLNFYMNRVLPERLYNRVYTADRNYSRRIELFEDSIKIIRDYPLFGTGGGGFAALYYGYQDQLYHSREVHNHYLQVWVEAGLLGFLSFSGMWLILALALVRNIRESSRDRKKQQYLAAVFLPAAALGAHSAIDWNFSLAAVGIFLFVLLGVFRSLDQVPWFEKYSLGESWKSRSHLVIGAVSMVLGVALLIFIIVLTMGHHATWRAHQSLEQGNIKQATTELESAIRFDPFTAENFYKLSVLIEEQGRRTNNPAAFGEAVNKARRAYELEPYNPTYNNRYGTVLFQYVDIQEGLSYLDRLIEIRPFLSSSYHQYINARFRLSDSYLEAGNRAAAETYLEEIISLEARIIERFGSTNSFDYELGRAYFFLNDYSSAKAHLRNVSEEHTMFSDAEAMLELME